LRKSGPGAASASRSVAQQTEQIAIDHPERCRMAFAREPRRGDLEMSAPIAIEHGEALIHITPIRQPDGSISHYLAILEDVTEKKHMTEELLRHRHHLEDIVASRTVASAD
jgi:hypothetical protein